MPVDLSRDTIFVALAGSHAHGTARPDSDVDLRGVCIAPLGPHLSGELPRVRTRLPSLGAST